MALGTMPALLHCRNKKCQTGPNASIAGRITPPRQADIDGRDRIKRHDCFGTMSERIVTPRPFATIDLTASPEEVRSVTDG